MPTSDALVAALGRLVATRSVNPGTSEAAMVREVRGLLDGLPVELHEVETMPGRPSLAAVMASGLPGPRLVINGHMDTVPVDDAAAWETDPFAAVVRDGYVHGRGACDMKAGLVAGIAAAQALAASGGPARGALVLHFAVGEEQAEPGTLSLCLAGFGGDVGIVTEPTGLAVAIAARGRAGFRITLRGRSAHASRPANGVNPIDALPAVLAVLDRHARERGGHHPLLPPGSCTPTVIRAGAAQNAVPDACELLVDRRVLPGQTIEGERGHLAGALATIEPELGGVAVEVGLADAGFQPAEIAASSPFAERVNRAAHRVTGTPSSLTGTPFSSDVHVLVAAGVEAVTFGPGHIGDCHCANERVPVDHLHAAATVLAEVAGELLL